MIPTGRHASRARREALEQVSTPGLSVAVEDGVLGVKGLLSSPVIDRTAGGIGANAIMRENGGYRSVSRTVVGGKIEIDNS